MFNALLPKGAPFFELLLKQNQFLCEVSSELVNIFESSADRDFADDEKLRQSMATLESEADRIHLAIRRHLTNAFITPIDREDILRISNAQEETIDLYNNMTDRFHLLELIHIPPFMLRLASTLKTMTPLVRSMLEGLSKKMDSHNTRQFLALRDECEKLLREGIKELYDVKNIGPDGIFIIVKWTRGYDRMELIVDHMVKLFEAIEEAILKHV